MVKRSYDVIERLIASNHPVDELVEKVNGNDIATQFQADVVEEKLSRKAKKDDRVYSPFTKDFKVAKRLAFYDSTVA